MKQYNSSSRKVFLLFNYLFLSMIGVFCLLPLVHVLAISFSSSEYVAAGEVKFWPVGFTLKAYGFVSNRPEFIRSFLVAIQRVALGLSVNLLLTLLSAFVLSRDEKKFRWRNIYAWYFVVTMIFSGGLIPGYLVVKGTGLINSIWALILPGAVPVFSVILLMNFFKGLPRELEEAAYIDGAGHWRILTRIFVPLSKPALATITLLMIVGHWNSWFDGLIFMNKPDKYPLQSYLQTVIITPDFKFISSTDLELLRVVNDRTSKAAQIFLATLPILMVYPFLQKYFTSGLVMGSVKG